MIALLFLPSGISPQKSLIIPLRNLENFLKENPDSLLIDVSANYFKKIHTEYKNKIEVSSSEINARMKELYKFKEKKILLYGDYDLKCVHILRQEGFKDITLLQ